MHLFFLRKYLKESSDNLNITTSKAAKDTICMTQYVTLCNKGKRGLSTSLAKVNKTKYESTKILQSINAIAENTVFQNSNETLKMDFLGGGSLAWREDCSVFYSVPELESSF